MLKTKALFLLISLVFLSSACNLGRSITAGIIKTTNGGVDWQFANKMETGTTVNINNARISKIQFDPQNSQTLYAGSYNLGLFKSENSAESWKVILSKLAVYDFVVNPLDSKTIYAAGSFGDYGKVLKTEDGGGSWQEIYNEAIAQNPVRAIALNPDNPNHLLVGTASGNLIRSADGGLTWQLVKNFGDRINRVLWQNGQIYVLLRAKGLYKSASAVSDSFEYLTESLAQNLNLGISFGNPKVERFNQALVDPIAGNLLYLATNLGIYKSTDGGKSWLRLHLPVKEDVGDAWTIAVSKISSNLVFTNVGATIFKSTDAGVSWQTQSVNTAGFINYILIDPQLPQIAYAGIYVP